MNLSYLKTVVFGLLSLAVLTFANQQDSVASFGFRMGAGYASFWNVDAEEDVAGVVAIDGLDDLEGMWANVGATVKIPLGGSFWFRPEVSLAYQRKTGSTAIDFGVADESVSDAFETFQRMAHLTIKQLSLNIPLMLRYQSGSGFYTEAGVVPSVNLSTELDYSVFKVAVDNLARDVVFGGAFYIGKSLKLGSGLLDVGVGFSLSISSLISDEIQVPLSPVSFDGSSFVDPRDVIVQLTLTYWVL